MPFGVDRLSVEVVEVHDEWSADLDRVWKNPLEERRVDRPSIDHSIHHPLPSLPTTCGPPCNQSVVQSIFRASECVGVGSIEGRHQYTFYGLPASQPRGDAYTQHLRAVGILEHHRTYRAMLESDVQAWSLSRD